MGGAARSRQARPPRQVQDCAEPPLGDQLLLPLAPPSDVLSSGDGRGGVWMEREMQHQAAAIWASSTASLCCLQCLLLVVGEL